MGRWKPLLLVLLLGGFAEASLGQVGWAQPVAPPEATTSEIAAPETVSPVSPEAVTDEAMAEPEAIAPSETSVPEIDAESEASESEPIVAPAAESVDSEAREIEAETVEEAEPAEKAETEIETAPETPASIVETNPAPAERVYLGDQPISFVPPPGFTAMGPEEIKLKFPRSMPPNYAYANATRDVSVGITVSEIPLDPAQLPEVKTVLEDFLETSVPGFQWVEHDFINLGGQDWIKLEFISQTDEQRIHNDMYITSLEGKLLGFNFNANLALDATLRNLLQDSRNSILLDQTVASDEGPIP